MITAANATPDEGLTQTGVDMLDMWLAIGGLVIAAVVGALLIHSVHRHYNRTDDHDAGPFTLHDLRQLRDAGKLTDEEYDHLRTQLIGGLSQPSESSSSTAEDPT